MQGSSSPTVPAVAASSPLLSLSPYFLYIPTNLSSSPLQPNSLSTSILILRSPTSESPTPQQTTPLNPTPPDPPAPTNFVHGMQTRAKLGIFKPHILNFSAPTSCPTDPISYTETSKHAH